VRGPDHQRRKRIVQRYLSLAASTPKVFANTDALLEVVLNLEEIEAWQSARIASLRESGLPGHWADIGVVLDDPYVLAIRDLVRFPDGSLNGYLRFVSRASAGGACGVVVLPARDGQLLLLRQFRHATRQWHLEAPRGFGTVGMTADESARAEIREEVEGEIEGEILDLGTLHSNTGLEHGAVQLFLAHLRSVGAPDRMEGIEQLRWVSTSRLEELIRDAVLTDAFTIAAYTRARLRNLI
jgi:ADP-ribose pyrophosphatase